MTDHDTCTDFHDGRGIVAPGPLRAMFVDANGSWAEEDERESAYAKLAATRLAPSPHNKSP